MKKITIVIFLTVLSLMSYSQSQTILHVNVSDMVYDNSRNKLFAIIHSTDTQYGNKVLQIDCNSKSIEKSLFVGSDPNLIDITHDNQYLYISLEGSPKIVRVDIKEFIIDLQFPIGPIDDYIDVKATSIETVPKNSELLAVCRYGDYNEDLVLFESGTMLSDSFRLYYVDLDEIETDSSGTLLFGSDGDEFFRFNITNTGILKIDEYDGVLNGGGNNPTMHYINGLLYTSSGEIINPHTSIPFIEGQFAGIESRTMAISELNKESYFGTFDNFSETLRIRRYNIETYTLIDIKELDIIFPETMSDPELNEFICYGNDKFVISAQESYFSEDNEKYIVFIDGIYSSTESTSTGFSQNKILVYPNPVTEFVTIELNQSGTNSKIELVNINGQIVYTEFIEKDKKVKVDVRGYYSGIYLIRISDGKNVMTRLLVIE